MNRDPKIESAYTEQEAKDEVVKAARHLLMAGRCPCRGCNYCRTVSAAHQDLRDALYLVDTYKGVK